MAIVSILNIYGSAVGIFLASVLQQSPSLQVITQRGYNHFYRLELRNRHAILGLQFSGVDMISIPACDHFYDL